MRDDAKPTLTQLKGLVADVESGRDFSVPLAAKALAFAVAALEEARRERDAFALGEHEAVAKIGVLKAERDEARRELEQVRADAAVAWGAEVKLVTVERERDEARAQLEEAKKVRDHYKGQIHDVLQHLHVRRGHSTTHTRPEPWQAVEEMTSALEKAEADARVATTAVQSLRARVAELEKEATARALARAADNLELTDRAEKAEARVFALVKELAEFKDALEWERVAFAERRKALAAEIESRQRTEARIEEMRAALVASKLTARAQAAERLAEARFDCHQDLGGCGSCVSCLAKALALAEAPRAQVLEAALREGVTTLELYADPACCDGEQHHEDKCKVGQALVTMGAALSRAPGEKCPSCGGPPRYDDPNPCAGCFNKGLGEFTPNRGSGGESEMKVHLSLEERTVNRIFYESRPKGGLARDVAVAKILSEAFEEVRRERGVPSALVQRTAELEVMLDRVIDDSSHGTFSSDLREECMALSTKDWVSPAPVSGLVLTEEEADKVSEALEFAVDELETDENYVGKNGGEVDFLVGLREALAILDRSGKK